MRHDAGVGIAGQNRVTGTLDEPVMIFGTCEVTSTQLRTGRREDMLDLLTRHGVKRFAAERILEIHCGDDANNIGRARSHATSRAASSSR